MIHWIYKKKMKGCNHIISATFKKHMLLEVSQLNVFKCSSNKFIATTFFCANNFFCVKIKPNSKPVVV